MLFLRLLVLCAFFLSAQAWGQVRQVVDPYEIHVYEYEPMGLGEFSYEAHTSYGQEFHFSSELTAGITDQFRMAAVFLTADDLQYRGFHVLPHFYARPSWGLPFNLGLVVEFAFETNQPRHVELRPILEKHIGRLQLDANPVATHVFAPSGGWVFEPAARIGWRATKLITPSFEYYGSFSRTPTQQVYPGADLHLNDRLTWNLGVGFGLTDYGSRVIWKSRFEIDFGRRH